MLSEKVVKELNKDDLVLLNGLIFSVHDIVPRATDAVGNVYHADVQCLLVNGGKV